MFNGDRGMSFWGTLFGGDEKNRVESSFIEYVNGAGRLIDARLPKDNSDLAGLVLCCATKVCAQGGDEDAYEEAESVLCKYFDDSIMKVVREIVMDIQKVVEDFEETADRETLLTVRKFIEEHGSGDIENGVDAVCSVLSLSI